MQEVLAKTEDNSAPLKSQEFYELCLDDSYDPVVPGYVVTQWHARWNECHRAILWDDCQEDRCLTLNEAQNRYEARRKALVEEGFIYSDMDM